MSPDPRVTPARPTSSTTPVGALAAERVLDLSTSISGAYCTKLLGDLGAAVVKVESPDGGDPLRARGPFPPSGSGPESSAPFLYFNTSKHSVALDIDGAAGREELARLVAGYDIVVADGPLAQLTSRGLGLDILRTWNPAVILCTTSGFGSDGPYAGYASSHLITCAVSSWALTCGLADREPLQSGGSLTETVSGAYAAVAVLGAVEGRARNGHGEHIDVCDWEAAVTCAMAPTFNYEFRGVIDSRHSDYMTGPSFNIRCRDGYVGVNSLTEAQWQTLCAFIGREDMATDPRFGDFYGRLEHIEEIRAQFDAAFGDRFAEEVFTEAQLWRIPFGLVLSPVEALDLPVHAARDYFEAHDHPGIGTIRTPRAPFVMSSTNVRPTRAPTLGEHTRSVLAELPPAAVRVAPVGAPSTGREDVPLAGLRILDLTMFMSGPLATLLAADLGADVIKVEAIQRLDGWRGPGRGGDRPWENSGLFNWINRNKRGITLNLTDPRGADLLRQLVVTADVIIENYTPRVMENFGLGYPRLKEINPNLIMVSMPGFGQTGPWRDYAAFAWTTEQMSTITHLTGYADGPPLFSGTTCGDPLAGLMGALAMLAAINHRRRTGESQHIDLSQVESSTTFVGEFLVEAQITGTDPTRTGNTNRWMAPHGTYRCRDDRWIAIACRDDAMWTVLWQFIGRPLSATEGPAADGSAPYASLADRQAAADEIDGWIAAFTADHDPRELMHALQARGIAAGAVLDGRDLLEDRHLRERGFFIPLARDEIGVKSHMAEPFRMAEALLPDPVRAAYLGEHNREVLCGILGLSDDDYARLEADAVIGMRPVGVPANHDTKRPTDRDGVSASGQAG